MTFRDFFGNTARARLLDFLGDHPASDYSITELAAKARVSRPTVYAELDALQRLKLVLETRKLGRSRLFRLNGRHPIVRDILSAELEEARGAAGRRRPARLVGMAPGAGRGDAVAAKRRAQRGEA